MASDHARRNPRLQQIAAWLEHPQSIRTIFFDVGFTMIYPKQSSADTIHQACSHKGLHIPKEDIARRMSIAEQVFQSNDLVLREIWADNDSIFQFWQEFYTTIMTTLVPDDEISKIMDLIIQEIEHHSNWELYDDVIPVLEKLHHHYKLGVISDWDYGLGAMLRNMGIVHYFDVMLVSAIHRRAKPNPKLFEEALIRANAIGQFTLYVGDTYIQDILGARNSGINPILLDRSHRVKRSTMDCVVIRSLSELPHLLELD